jgi:hypothetical protein
MKRLVIDIYGYIDETDIGKVLDFEIGEVRCSETGELFKGTFTINSMEKAGEEDLNEQP